MQHAAAAAHQQAALHQGVAVDGISIPIYVGIIYGLYLDSKLVN